MIAYSEVLSPTPGKGGKMAQGHVYRRGRIWWIKYYRNGKPFYESSKSRKKSIANELLKKRNGEVAEGRVPGIYFEKATFEDLVKLLEADYKLKGQKRNRTGNLEKYFKSMRVIGIGTGKIKEYIAQRQEKGAAAATINRELAALKRMFRLGAQETPPMVERVPYIPMLREDNVKEGFLEGEQYLALLTHLPAHLRPVLTFGYRTGWRINEIRNLTWDRVNLEERTVRLSASQTKNKSARAIYLDDELLHLMRHQALKKGSGSPYVFHLKGSQIRDFRVSWNTACRNAGLGYGYRLDPAYVKKWEKEGFKPGPTFHDLRRSAARNLIRAGVGRDVAKAMTGHKTDSVFSRYNITSQEDMKEAALKHEKFLSNGK
jgi:integrase